VVQEYERAVIFRLGRVLLGGAKGPGTSRYIIIPSVTPYKVPFPEGARSWPHVMRGS